MPFFSVVIPTYNRASSISRTLRSVADQTFTDIEVIVVDDGSEDNTEDVILATRLRHSGIRWKYIRKKNQGPAASRNVGVNAADGLYVAFLDSDDVWLPKKLEIYNSARLQNPDVGLWYSDYRVVDRHGNFLENICSRVDSSKAYTRLLIENFIGTSTAVVKKSCFMDVGGFMESLPVSEDYDLWIRICRKFSVGHIAEVLTEYIHQSEGSLLGTDRAYRDARIVVERALAADPNLSYSLRNKIEGRLLYREGTSAIGFESGSYSLSKLMRSAWKDPCHIKTYLYWLLIATGTLVWGRSLHKAVRKFVQSFRSHNLKLD